MKLSVLDLPLTTLAGEQRRLTTRWNARRGSASAPRSRRGASTT
jgi:hypothetical protein